MVPGYNPGSDITVLNTVYQYPKRTEEGDGYEDDFITILYRDNKTGKKGHHVIYKPDYEYFILNPNIEVPNYNLFFIEKDNVYSRMVPYTNLLRDIADQTNNTEFFFNNIRNGNRQANRQLHTLQNIFNSDMHIEDHYRYRFDKLYTNTQCDISKAYFDIEVDTIDMVGDFPELGECPINAVSYIYNDSIKIFLLRNKENPLIEEFEKSIDKSLFNELNQFIIDNVGGDEKAKKYHLENLDYEFLFYDEEICLINDLFKFINKNEPDFLLAWNMAFDIPYIIERIKKLGYNPKDFLCHPSYDKSNRIVEYFIDEMHKNEYEARGDYYKISSNTIYLDQLIHFASRRKGQSAFPNFKLDTAGSIITGVRKLDYSNITTNIAKLPYLNYKVFVFYNIMDTIVQKCIEEEVADINYIFGKCLINNTRYNKGHRQTVYLANRATKSFDIDGFTIGNNVNALKAMENEQKPQFDENGKPIKKGKGFAGALVGDPTHNSDYSKIRLGNQIVNIVDNLDDYDFKSLYPSIEREFNIAPNTQIGKIIIPNNVHKYENPFDFEHYDRGGQFIEDFVCQNIITFSNRWLGFATFREWLDDLHEFYRNIEHPSKLNWDHRRLMVKIPDNYMPRLMTKMNRDILENDYHNRLMYKTPKPLDYDSYLKEGNNLNGR